MLKDRAKKIVILCHVVFRDLLIDNKLANILANKYGHAVWVRPFVGKGRSSIQEICPDVVVVTDVKAEYTRDYAKVLHDSGTYVISRRGEPAFSSFYDELLSDNRKKRMIGTYDYSGMVDKELVWGEPCAEMLRERGWLNNGEIHSCGAFNFDPYFYDDFDTRYPGREDFNKRWQLDNEKKTIMFVSDWSYADRSAEFSVPEAERGDKSHSEYYEDCVLGRAKWLEAIKNISASGKYNIIVKVHPAEQPQWWVKNAEQYARIMYHELSAIAVKNVDLVIHSGSTVAVEGSLIGVPALQYCSFPRENPNFGFSPLMDTESELMNQIPLAIEAHKSNHSVTKFEEMEKYFYGIIDGKACERAAEKIHEFIKDLDIKTTPIAQWPENEQGYEIKGQTYKKSQQEVWFCNACQKQTFSVPGKKTIRCTFCGLCLLRNDFEGKEHANMPNKFPVPNLNIR